MLFPPDGRPRRRADGRFVIRPVSEPAAAETTPARLRDSWFSVGEEWKSGAQSPHFDFVTTWVAPEGIVCWECVRGRFRGRALAG